VEFGSRSLGQTPQQLAADRTYVVLPVRTCLTRIMKRSGERREQTAPGGGRKRERREGRATKSTTYVHSSSEMRRS
jgi:hypothetical protein